ncbi:putative zeaxanthin 7,8(7',8')-cleavage dioxygenase, chromoplastic [Iris pallida]|uniref:Zeaxanthin 7,8(7',8')-cleavage dioxygenase, chromoplastic n=1 Tax=Iris pallida TaxID=29817 RepID=A0AAX6HZX1_IRIPA|nr:putative zeaxanthin 7,8(7',8')-cleavage dioxygenase, chromoplastic [Iris pallida]
MDALSSSFLSCPFFRQSTRTTRIIQPPSLILSPSPLGVSAAQTIQEKPSPANNNNTTTQKQATTTTTIPTVQPKKKNYNTTGKESSSSTSIAPPLAPPSLAATFCNALDSLIDNFIDPPVLRPSVDPRHVLQDNFAPVGELPPTPCPVVRGSIPPCLGGGAYIRNGPNPQHLPRGPHHLFDGDGMLHSLLLPAGGGTAPATLCSRFVHTYKYTIEHKAGGPVFPNVFSGFHGVGGMARGAVSAVRVITGQMNPAEGVGLANTSLLFFADKLYALGESDLPYAVHLSPDGGGISTLGRSDFQGKLSMGMTAHPKQDPVTGELFAFRYGPVPPYLTYFRFDRAGRKSGPDVPIFSVNQPSFLHDFAITEHYAIFPDIQIVMKPMEMVMGGGSPVGSDPGKVPRIGLLPRYASSEAEMRWFDMPGFNIMHAINAWEEEDGNVIVLVAPNVLSIEHAIERTELVHSCVEMVRIDLRTGVASRTPLSAGNLDFGVIHPGYVGRKNRYAYLGVGDPMPKISGAVKLDFGLAGKSGGDCVVAKRMFGPGCFGGEPFFVPADHAEAGADEDKGYVVTYVHNEEKGESRFLVMDAQSPDLEIVAEVLLPRRVPYGFHGLFVTDAQLRSQLRLP